MNWLHFFIWLGGIYILYYLAVILFDLAGAKQGQASGSTIHELTFSENVAPVQMSADTGSLDQASPKTKFDKLPSVKKNEPEMMGSGGVVIDNLFKLCKQEAIIYTRSVSF